MKTILTDIKKINFFHNIPEIDLINLVKLFVKKNFSRNEIIMMAGYKWEEVYLISQGIIRVYYTDMDGREHNKGFFRENQILWPVAPSARTGNIRFSIAPIESVSVYACTFSSFHSWLVQHNLWEKYALFHAESLLEDKYTREYEFLMNSATERFRNFCIEYPELVNRIPDYHLASYLGITNVSLSRIKKTTDFNLC